VPSEPSARDTAEVVRALLALGRGSADTSIDPRRVLADLVQHHRHQADAEHLALLLWADAFGGGEHAGTLTAALDDRLEAEEPSTLGWAWILSAACAAIENAGGRDREAAVARRAACALAANQHRTTGLFHPSARREGWIRRRRRTATVSSQTYAVQALSAFARRGAPESAEAADRAEACARALCGLQGPQGQWWRRYDVTRGTVVERYPVHTVNQDGGVPMALAELHRTMGDRRHAVALARGIEWVFGPNEIGQPLLDAGAGDMVSAVEEVEGGFRALRDMNVYHPARCLFALHLLESSETVTS
jgi:hypothetical protein